MHCEGSYPSRTSPKALLHSLHVFILFVTSFFFLHCYLACLLRGYPCSSAIPPKNLKFWWCHRFCLVPCIYRVHITLQLLISGRFFFACRRPWSPHWLGQSCSCPLPLTCSGSLPGGGSHRWLCCRPSSVLLHCFSGGKGRVRSHSTNPAHSETSLWWAKTLL